MYLFNKQHNILLLLICIALSIIIFYWINYLVKNNYLIEMFDSMSTSDTVSLPLTTTYSCQNFCGPTSTCAITGQQCGSDIDCPGCQPYSPPLKYESTDIPGENDAGKLSFNKTPQYSTLTTDIGTQSALYTLNKFNKPPSTSSGVNVWKTSFEHGQRLFDKRYKPKNLQYMPTYKNRYSATGQFNEDGPLAANDYFVV